MATRNQRPDESVEAYIEYIKAELAKAKGEVEKARELPENVVETLQTWLDGSADRLEQKMHKKAPGTEHIETFTTNVDKDFMITATTSEGKTVGVYLMVVRVVEKATENQKAA